MRVKRERRESTCVTEENKNRGMKCCLVKEESRQPKGIWSGKMEGRRRGQQENGENKTKRQDEFKLTPTDDQKSWRQKPNKHV